MEQREGGNPRLILVRSMRIFPFSEVLTTRKRTRLRDERNAICAIHEIDSVIIIIDCYLQECIFCMIVKLLTIPSLVNHQTKCTQEREKAGRVAVEKNLNLRPLT